MNLENIGEDDTALLCMTNLTACCRRPYTGENVTVFANWYFPNGTRVPSILIWDFYRNRGQSLVRLNRRNGEEEGIYRCEIPDSMNVTQTLYVGVYNTSSGEV